MAAVGRAKSRSGQGEWMLCCSIKGMLVFCSVILNVCNNTIMGILGAWLSNDQIADIVQCLAQLPNDTSLDYEYMPTATCSPPLYHSRTIPWPVPRREWHCYDHISLGGTTI